MIIYEVNLTIEPAIATDFRQWLQKHINDMLALDCFYKAAIFEKEAQGNESAIEFCTHYYTASRAQLDIYFDQHSAAMRADGIQRFGDQFTATRRILRAFPE